MSAYVSNLSVPLLLAYSAEKEFIAQVRKRQLLAEIVRERIAAGTPTYILCPRVPEPATPERLAA